MLRVVICDDDPKELSKIHVACQNYFTHNTRYTAEIITFDNPIVCLDALEKIGGCDIALLDICMPGITGLSVAKEILSANKETQVIFVTTSDEFAVEAFGVGAIHYIVKPFTQKAFDLGMDRTITKFDGVPIKWFLLNGKGGAIKKINANDIQYIESFRNERAVHTQKDTYAETKHTLQKMLDDLTALCPKQFISPYRGYIVNFEAVDTITKDGLLLKNNVTLPIKPDAFRKVRDSYMDYEFGKKD